MRLIILAAIMVSLCCPGRAEPKPQAAAPATPEDVRSVSDLTEAARPSIVTVTQIGRGGMHEALGTGFVVSPDGIIATNMHVIGHARRIQVQFADGTVKEVTSVHASDQVLDLALIKVEAHGLKPLELGDSDKVKQGTAVVALGHPQGLQFSVVEGVVSAKREVEGSEMLQVAIPIEEGNSGGPLLDMQGHVQGMITLKSAVTENLGFAHPVNELKRLIAHPNPVPMSRWLTIGKLDSGAWETLLGARWTQHAGVIHVDDAGEGFGGRSLCLAKGSPPASPFECAVTVRLDNESGAAGLIFCAEGADRHYGFYPSGGRLRLTRFNGPDVFSWTILADVPVASYKKGGWNTLRVRVDAEKIECFVNDKLAVEQKDTVFRGGAAGLCKFRSTKAEFRGFATGANLEKHAPSAELASLLTKELDHFLEKPSQRDKALEKLAAEPVAARTLLEDKARSLEDQAASLRRLQKDVNRQSVAKELVSLLQRPADQTELLRAALLISKYDNPDLDVDAYLRLAGRMAAELKDDPAIKQGTPAAARRLAKYLFEESGFHGSRGDDIDNLSNSYLNEVLDDREGIPITLSIVFLDLARRVGVKGIYGVALPGRFMLGFDEPRDGKKMLTIIDAFDGGKFLTRDEADAMVNEFGSPPLEDRHFEPATPRSIILRMLYNLSNFSRKPEQVSGYLDLILSLDPGSAQERLNRALIRVRSGDAEGARKDLEKLITEQPKELDMEKVEALYRSL